MRGSPAHHVWRSPPPPNCCFISVGERNPTQSAVITLEILDVTMEAFVSVLNGLPGHSFGLLIALNQYLGFSILLAAPRGDFSFFLPFFGTAQKEISSGQQLLIVLLLCYTICLLELSGIIDEEYRYTHLFPFFSALLICR